MDTGERIVIVHNSDSHRSDTPRKTVIQPHCIFDKDTYWRSPETQVTTENTQMSDYVPTPTFREDLDTLKKFHEAEKMKYKLIKQYDQMRSEAEAAKNRVANTVRQVEINIATSEKEDGRFNAQTPGDLRDTRSYDYNYIDTLPGEVVGQAKKYKQREQRARTLDDPEAQEGRGRLMARPANQHKSTCTRPGSPVPLSLCPSTESCLTGFLLFIRTRTGLLLVGILMALLAMMVFTVSADIILEQEIGSTILTGHKALMNLFKTKAVN